jgi:hypothetical protein
MLMEQAHMLKVEVLMHLEITLMLKVGMLLLTFNPINNYTYSSIGINGGRTDAPGSHAEGATWFKNTFNRLVFTC